MIELILIIILTLIFVYFNADTMDLAKANFDETEFNKSKTYVVVSYLLVLVGLFSSILVSYIIL